MCIWQWVYAHNMSVVPVELEAPDPLKMELQTVASCRVCMLGAKLRSSEQAASEQSL